MEHKEYKGIISIFSTTTKYRVFPKKGHLIAVTILSAFIFLLYLLLLVLYIITTAQSITDGHPLLLTKALVEHLLTICSIVISIYATYITDYISKACTKQIERIKEKHDSIIKKLDIEMSLDDTATYLRRIRTIEIAFLSVFALYFLSAIIFCVCTNCVFLDIISFSLSAISTILTIILAIMSTFSCYVTAKYNSSLLKIVDKYAHSLFSKYNRKVIFEDHSVKS